MGLQWPVPDYVDGSLSSAAACGLPEFFAISPATTAEYAFRQEWMMLRASFAPTALDTAHPSTGLTPDFSSYFLVKEDDRKDAGGGLVKWTRTYAKAPPAYDDFESFAYHFIGYQGFIMEGSVFNVVTGRPRVTRVVSSRVHCDFYQTADPKADIPSIFAQRYLTGGSISPGLDTDWLADAITVGTITFPATNPTLTAYKALVTAGTEVVAEDSRIERMFGSGNLWVRKTRYVVAQ